VGGDRGALVLVRIPANKFFTLVDCNSASSVVLAAITLTQTIKYGAERLADGLKF